MQAMTVAVDRAEYCRYPIAAGDTRNQIQAYLTFQGAQSTDTVTVNLVRLTGYTDGQPQTLASQTLSLQTNQPSALVTFDLEGIREQQPYAPPTVSAGGASEWLGCLYAARAFSVQSGRFGQKE